jgi:pentatricopeptide repeat protein
VWDDLAAVDIKPGVTMWTGLLDTYADLRNSKQAMVTWNMMLQQDILPDSLSYRAIISVLFDDNNPGAALGRFAEYQKLLDGRDETALVVYNTVLRGLLRVNRVQEAKDLLKEMKSRSPQPDIFSFNTFLGYFARQKDFQGLGDVLTQMSTVDIQGDVVTFSTILTALLAVGRTDAPTTIMNLMRKQGVKPNAATYTAVIDHQMREQSSVNLGAALTLLEKMEKEEGIKPNEITYTAILAGLYRSQWLSREEADPIRERLVAKMRSEGIKFRLPTYHILLRASLDSEDEMSYVDALKLIREMKKNGIPRVGNTWYILLSGLMKRQLWQVAYEMVGTMLGSGHEPNDKLKSMVQEIHRKHEIESNTTH